MFCDKKSCICKIELDLNFVEKNCRMFCYFCMDIFLAFLGPFGIKFVPFFEKLVRCRWFCKICGPICKLSRPGQSTMVWSRTDLRATTALARCLVATPVVEFTRTNLHGPWTLVRVFDLLSGPIGQVFPGCKWEPDKTPTCRRSFPLWPALRVGPQQCFAEISA